MEENKASHLEKETRNLFSNWLEKLQQESWQLELVISGIALYLIAGAKTYLDDFAVYVSMHEGIFDFPVLEYLHTLLQGGWVIFMINFIVHILGRGFWIGVI
ncbi:MAG: hypothetical protein IT268_11415 [Saprospiraceae bacterium]|nr:hypothetical protein [Saprospiraceae bacterium]